MRVHLLLLSQLTKRLLIQHLRGSFKKYVDNVTVERKKFFKNQI